MKTGAVPATIAIIQGRSPWAAPVNKSSIWAKRAWRWPRPAAVTCRSCLSRGEDGATTVTPTMIGAALAGIRVFATGGVGGVHRGAETTMDISADLEELAQTQVLVVCAGAKSILDLGLTLNTWKPRASPSSATAPRNCPPSIPRIPDSRWTTGWTPQGDCGALCRQAGTWDWRAHAGDQPNP